MAQEGKKCQTKQQNVLPTNVDLKSYLRSLDELSREVAKDANNYEAFSPILQMKLDSFKSIFGNCKFTKFCENATIIYRNIMLTMQKFNPDHANIFFANWKEMLNVFTATSRAIAFRNNVGKFECIVERLTKADNRCSQLAVMSVLLLYTTEVNKRQIRDLHKSNPSSFLKIMMKIVDLPHPHHQQTSIKTNNAFLTNFNSETGLMLSFQPYKIVCGDNVYCLSDYELWMDVNVRTKVISFIAISVTEDKTKNVTGLTSTVELKIDSRQDDLIIMSNWFLTTKTDFKVHKMKIEFCFSPRIHTAILESNFSNVFKLPQLDEKAVDSNLKADAPSLEVNTKLAQETILPSINEIKFVELEKLKALADSFRIQKLKISEESTKHEDSHFGETIKSTDVLKIIESQRNPVFKSDVKKSGNGHRSFSASKLRKRRSAQEADCGREESYGEKNEARSMVSKVPKFETLSVKVEGAISASVEKAMENFQTSITRNDARIHDLAEVILMAAGDMIRTLGYNHNNDQVTFHVPINNVNDQVECSSHIPLTFDKNVFLRSWPIRKFIQTLREQPDYGAEIEENILPVVEDYDDYDCYYDSISNP